MPNLRLLKPKRLRKVRRPAPPSGIELEYFLELKRVLSYAKALVKLRLLPELRDLLSRARLDDVRADAMPPGKKVNRVMDRISEVFFRRFTQEKLSDLTDRIGRATSDHQKTQLFKSVKSALSIDLDRIADAGLSKRIAAFTASNVTLIETIPQKYFDQVERVVMDGMRDGARHEDIAVEIEKRFDVSKSEAALIARDQVSKFTSELSRARHESLGLTRYTWRTVNDSRVRPEHEDLEGEIFAYDGAGAPHEGHPGEAINCRCFDEPVFDDLFESAS